MKVFSIELKRPTAVKLMLTVVVLALLSTMVIASFGGGRVAWASVGALVGGGTCSLLGVDSTRGGRELVFSTVTATVFALIAMGLHGLA
jgi:hypothetical protein